SSPALSFQLPIVRDMVAPYVGDSIGMAQFFFILAGVPSILFSGLLAFVLSKCIAVMQSRAHRAGIAIIITLASFGSIAFLSGTGFPVNLVTGLLSLLWFPMAVIIPALFIPERYGKSHLHVLVAFAAMLAYIFAELVLKAGSALGLRSASTILIFPPPPVPYAMMQWPQIFHATFEFFILAGFAVLLVSLMLWYQRRWQKTPVRRDEILAIGSATVFCWMGVLFYGINPEEILQTLTFLVTGIIIPLIFLYSQSRTPVAIS
ncbi:MAG: hypothetical protein Q8R70_08735, partial [Methanoregula sp.]|nr:hypothetical protein [Methanoregula sp.]